MYGIYANIEGIWMLNVTIYSIHGSYGIWQFSVENGKWYGMLWCSFFKVNPFWWDDCEIIDLHDVIDIGYIGEMWLIWLMIVADSFAVNIRILLPSGDPELQRRFACG